LFNSDFGYLEQCAAFEDKNNTCHGRNLKHLVHLLGEQQIKKVSFYFCYLLFLDLGNGLKAYFHAKLNLNAAKF